MKKIIFVLVTLVALPIFCIGQSGQQVPDSDKTYIRYLQQFGQDPAAYISGKFTDHDIVIVGETHQVKEYCELISGAIEKSQIDYFASEFLKSKHTRRANLLVSAKQFDRQLAIDIFRDYAWPIWGFEEYLNIFYTIWASNQKRGDADDGIKIIGMDHDWSQYESFCGRKRTNLYRFRQNMKRERNMVKTVQQKYSPGTKILVHVGFSHTLYKFRPRLAAELYSKYGDQVFQIGLHHQFAGDLENMTIVDQLETIMKSYGENPVGFDVLESPFADLSDPHSYYFQPEQHVSLKDICMGYVYIKPLQQLRTVTWIPGFINESNIHEALCVAHRMKFVESDTLGVDSFNIKMSERFNGK